MYTKYSIAATGIGATYYFMSAYFVVFLTNCVGLNAAIASTISAIALTVEVFAGMVVGNISDSCSSKYGKRRPFMFATSVAMVPILVFITQKVEFSLPLTVVYYLAFAILFRLFFSMYEIPYNALCAEIVTDYNERTRIRTVTRTFSIGGNAVGYIMPLVILDMFLGDEALGWQIIGIILAVVACSTFMYTVIFIKEPQARAVKARSKNVIKHILSSYLNLVKLKTMRLLVVYKIAFSCAFALYNVATIYFLQYNLGLGNRYSTYIYAFTIVIFVISTPFINKLAIAKSKSWEQMVSMAGCGMVGILIYLFAADSVWACAVYVGVFAVMTTGFWQLSGSIFFDIVEVDEYVNHKRREGDIASMTSVLGTLISAIMIQFYGILFDLSDFDASLEVQPDSVNAFLDATFILVPCLCLLMGALVLKIFPINKNTFDSLKKAIELRDKGEDYSEYMNDVKKIVG